MGAFFDKAKETRKLYDVLVERTQEIPNSRDGSTAARAILPGHTKTLIEEMGIRPEDTGTEYCNCILDYIDGVTFGSQGNAFLQALGDVRKKNTKPYAWRR